LRAFQGKFLSLILIGKDMSTLPAKQRFDNARAILPSVTAKYISLSIGDQRFLGGLPAKVGTLSDVRNIESMAERMGIAGVPAAAPVAKVTPPAAAKPSAAQILAAVTDPKTNAAAVAGIEKSLSLAARLGLSPDAQQITHDEFNSLTARQKSEYCRKGGKIAEPIKATVPKPEPSAKVLTVAQLNAHVAPAARAAFFKSGGTLKD